MMNECKMNTNSFEGPYKALIIAYVPICHFNSAEEDITDSAGLDFALPKEK